MSHMDMLRSVLGPTKSDEELKVALAMHGYDLSAAIAALMEGQPTDGITQQNELDTFFYKTGLLVNFDKEGDEAALLTFTPPQPDAPPPAAPKR